MTFFTIIEQKLHTALAAVHRKENSELAEALSHLPIEFLSREKGFYSPRTPVGLRYDSILSIPLLCVIDHLAQIGILSYLRIYSRF